MNKGAFVLGILLFLRDEFDGVIDGIVYAGFTAAGFAFTENIYYFGRAFAEYGIGGGTTPGVITAFIARGVLSPFTHPLFTVMIGIGIGVAARSASKRVRVLAPVGGYLGAVVLHALWNGAATLGTEATFFGVYFLVMVPLFAAVVLFVQWHRKREQRVIAKALPDMVSGRCVVASEVPLLGDLAGRRKWRNQVRKSAGKQAAMAVGQYQAAVSELAFHWHAIACGTAGPDALNTEAKLITTVRAARANAVRAASPDRVADRDLDSDSVS